VRKVIHVETIMNKDIERKARKLADERRLEITLSHGEKKL
jgi:hypothetical protein